MSLRKFYEDPYYNIRSFAMQTVVAVVLCVVFYSLHSANFYSDSFAGLGFTESGFSWLNFLSYVAYAVIGIYLGGISCVWIHNSTHKSFKSSALNEICGYIAGLHQLWGINGWRLIHLIHHQYSDNHLYDPHPPRGRSFGKFLREMFVQSSFTISRRYREHWKDSLRTRILQKAVFAALIAAAFSSLIMWFLLLGPAAFIFAYIPSLIWNHVMFAHINYYCHPADEQGKTAAANLNHNLYYKTANALWHGIYFHGNHHRKTTLFNPQKMNNIKKSEQALSCEQKEAS